MSGRAMRWARTQRAGGAAAKAVLHWLAERVDDLHHSWYCSAAEMRDELEMAERTVRYAVATLVQRQLLRVWRRGVEGRGGRGYNRYQLLVDGPATARPPHDDITTMYDPAALSAAAKQRVAARRQADQSPSSVDSKPANVAGLPADPKPARTEEQTGKYCRFEPANIAGLPIPHKEDINPINKPPSPPAPPAASATAPAGQEAGREHDQQDREAQRNAELRAELVLADVLVDTAERRWPSRWQWRRLVAAVSAAVDAGWTVRGLVRELSGGLATADSVYAALDYRLRRLGPPPLAAVPDLPEPRDHPPPAPAPAQAGGDPPLASRPPGWEPPPYLAQRPPADPAHRAAALAEARQHAARARARAREQGLPEWRPRRHAI